MNRNPLRHFIPARYALLVAPLSAAWPQHSRAANQEWAGASNGSWHILSNWTGASGFPGDSVANTAGEGLTTDIMSIAAANATGNIGVNMAILGGLTLGAIHINKTSATEVNIGSISGGTGIFQLNGATVAGVAGTIIRCEGSANLIFNHFNPGTSIPEPGVQLGIANGEIHAGASRTITINSILSEAAAGTGFCKTGAGTLTLTSNNILTGPVTVKDGVVQLQEPLAAGTGDILLTNNDGATVNDNDVLLSGGITCANIIVLENATTRNGRVRLRSNNSVNALTNTWNGTVTCRSLTPTGGIQALFAENAPLVINGNILQDSTLPSPAIIIHSNSAVAPGIINGNINLGTGTLFKTGAGVWTINSSGNVMGLVASAAGTLVLNNNNALAADSLLQMGQDSAATAFLRINAGFTQQLTGIATPGPTAVGIPAGTVSSSPAGHFIDGPGTVDFGALNRTVDVQDNAATLEDLTVNAPIAGSGGFTKSGPGILLINGAVAGPVTVSAGGLGGSGTLASTLDVAAGGIIGGGTAISRGTLIAAGITLGTGSNIAANVGTTAAGGSDFIANTGALTSGGTTIQIVPGGSVSNGDIPLIGYTGITPTTAPFTIAFPLPGGVGSRGTAVLVDTGTAIGINITGADKCCWSGATDANWDIATTANWILHNTNTGTTFQQLDALLFDDRGDDVDPSRTTIALNTAVNPVRAEFTNTAAVPYTIRGAGGFKHGPLPCTMVLDKTGNGTVTIATANAYLGATHVSDGLLIANMLPGAASATIDAIPTGSPVKVTGSGTVRFGGDNANASAVAINVPHVITGNGTVEHHPRMTAGQTSAVASTFTGNNTGFSGTLRLLTPASGTARLSRVPVSALGTASLDVQSGHQFFAAGGEVYPNAITISGTGYQNASGFLGALRLEHSANWSGPVSVASGGARICAHNTTLASPGIVSGNITGGPLEVNISNYPPTSADDNDCFVIFTGNNSHSTTTIGGQNTQTAGVPSYRLNIGSGGTTGTLGDGAVILNGDGANGMLGFDRSDGITLKPGNTITAAGSFLNRTFVDFDCPGTGFANGGASIDLGTAGGTGGQLRCGVTRANTVTTFTGTVEAGVLAIGVRNAAAPTNNASCTLASGANVSVTGITIAGGGTQLPGHTSGASLTVAAGATLNATQFLFGGDGVTNSSTTTISGDVTVGQQVRMGHLSNETSTCNMMGGSLTLSGDSPLNTPSTAGAGSNTVTGDNNINVTNPATLAGGGIYIGIEGQGVFNHNAGTVTTNWIVLDNRGNSPAGFNMTDGMDRYSLSGSALLKLRSEWGLIARNPSTDVSLGGGTIQLDNTGTGGPAGNTGADLDVPLDAVINTVALTTTTLDTNGAENSFILTRDLIGTGLLDLQGGGTIQIGAAGVQNISAELAGSTALLKTGGGTTILISVSGSYSGTTTVNAGTLRVDGTLGGTMTVLAAATLGGSGSVGALTVQSGGIISPGAGTGTLNAASASLHGGSRYDVEITGASTADKLNVTGALTVSGTVKTTLSGYVPVAGDSFDLADAGSFAGAPAFDFSAAGLTPGLAWDTSAFLTTGVISVINDDPFTAWAAGFGLTEGKNGDDDNDNVSNLLEFATNSVPTSASSGPRAFGAVATVGADSVLSLTIAVRKNALFAAAGSRQQATKDNVIYTVEASDDLLLWNTVVVTELNPADSAAVQGTLNLPTLDADWEWHTFRTDGTTLLDPRDMIRLSVAAQP